MEINQREIVIVNFKILPEGNQKHPCLIISSNEVQSNESFFIGVMLSSTTNEDDFTLWLNDDDLTVPAKKKTQVRCHIINTFKKEDIIGKPVSKMKRKPFEKVLDKIFNYVIIND